jgi:hypothetical protein
LLCKSGVKAHGSTMEWHWKLPDLSIGEVKGILGVRVKSVDIERNTSGEGALLVGY